MQAHDPHARLPMLYPALSTAGRRAHLIAAGSRRALCDCHAQQSAVIPAGTIVCRRCLRRVLSLWFVPERSTSSLVELPERSTT